MDDVKNYDNFGNETDGYQMGIPIGSAQQDPDELEIAELLEASLSALSAADRAMLELRDRLHEIHIYHHSHMRLEKEISDLGIHNAVLLRQASQLSQNTKLCEDGKAVLILGESGSGKTYITDRIVRAHSQFNLPYRGGLRQMWIALTIDLPLTKKGLAKQFLKALGTAPDSREDGETQLWQKVFKTLRDKKISLLHLDEVQHVARIRASQHPGEIRDILKQILNNNIWRMNVILSGMPNTIGILAEGQDSDQLIRRQAPVRLQPFTWSADIESQAKIEARLKDIISQYAAVAGYKLAPDFNSEFFQRLLVATGGRVGYISDLCIRAIMLASAIDERNRENGKKISKTLKSTVFKNTFESWTGRDNFSNPFVKGVDWKSMDGTNAMESARAVENETSAISS